MVNWVVVAQADWLGAASACGRFLLAGEAAGIGLQGMTSPGDGKNIFCDPVSFMNYGICSEMSR